MHLSDEFAGILGGLANGFGNLAGAVAPAVTGAILALGGCPKGDAPIGPACHSAWIWAFLVSAIGSVLAAVVFLVFGSAEKFVLSPPRAPAGACAATEERGAG